jgi:Yip1 domain
VDNNPRHQVILITVLPFVLWGLFVLLFSDASAYTPILAALAPFFPLLALGTMTVGSLLAILMLYLNGAVLRWSGALLGGVATPVEVRAAIAWAEVPVVVFDVIGILATLAVGVQVPPSHAGLAFVLTPSRLFEVGLGAIVAIWTFVIGLECLGEVHRISTWRALGAVLIPLGITIVTLAALAWALIASIPGGRLGTSV